MKIKIPAAINKMFMVHITLIRPLTLFMRIPLER